MRILGLIPARGGSKGVPGKNIRPLDGKPLLAYTAEVALASSMLTRVILSSDDAGIIEAGTKAGLEVPFTRPADLARDQTPTLAVIAHALEHFSAQGDEFDAVCLLQPTSPLRTIEFLDRAIQKFIDSQCDSLVSVRRVPHEYNPHWVYEVGQNGTLQIATGEKEIISRRQELPDAYHRDGSIYLTRTTALAKNTLYGDSIAFIESPDDWYVNIDTEADWQRAESLIKKLKGCAGSQE